MSAALHIYDISRVAPALEAGDWVITANRRLRNRIREAWAARQAAVGESPPVFSLQEWLSHCWEHLQNRSPALGAATVINDRQAAQLWQEVIGAQLDGKSLVNQRLVQQAAEAWRQLELWELPLQSLARYGEEVDLPLLGWVPAFKARLAELELISREESYRRILQAFESDLLPRLPRLWLESIPEQAPLLQRLLQAAADDVQSLPPLAASDNVQQRFAAPSTEDEIRAAARWARQTVQNAGGAGQTVIGIIVPDLGRSRDLVERIFTETFEAHYLQTSQPRYTLPFNISTGTPLAAAPVISAALQLLKLNQGQTAAAELRQVLNSPFWGDFEAESGFRAALLTALSERGQLRYSASQLRSSAQALANGECSEAEEAFARRLEAAGNLYRRLPARALPGEWLAQLLALLEEIGWPGQRALDSVEYQQVKQFHGLLEELASLDLLDSPMRLGDFLQILQQSAMSMPFQAEVRHSPIQILGSLEAEGLRFDHCWVLGMTSLAWPPKPEPNPLLPIALQREHQMPRSSTSRELAFAQALTEHYRRCARTVIFSHPLQVDEAQVLPSPLIAAIPLADGPPGDPASEPIADLPAFYAALQAARRLEVLDCEYGPPLDIAPGETVRGGAALLQWQARCPFDAFATLRLGARAPAQAAIGLSAADKGSALHAVMALIWEQLKNRDGLLAQGALPALVRAAAERVFTDIGQSASFELGPRYLQLEKERLCALVLHFLELEKKRPPFEVVAMEEERIVSFAGLDFRLRIDRVDRCESGGQLIIDYKSGNAPNPRQWLGERPDEPQLPLYALTWPGSAAGIAFACIRAREPGYCGLVDESLGSWDKGIKTVARQLRDEDASWQDLLSEFENTLGRLARDYQAGLATVDVQNPNVPARFHAHLLPLNRYGEADFIAFYLEGQN